MLQIDLCILSAVVGHLDVHFTFFCLVIEQLATAAVFISRLVCFNLETSLLLGMSSEAEKRAQFLSFSVSEYKKRHYEEIFCVPVLL